jgi:hypothetical protein
MDRLSPDWYCHPMRDPEETHAISYRGPWVIADLDDEWQAVYSLAPQGSEIVISGVEIRPRGGVPPGGLTTRLTRTLRPALALRLFRGNLAEHRTPGTVAHNAQEAAAAFVALGELRRHLLPDQLLARDTAAYLKSGAVTPEAVAEAVALLVAGDLPGWKDFVHEENERWTGWGAALEELGPGSRKPPRDRLRRLAETAALYVSARADNDPAPNQRVAEIQGRTASTVRDDLRAARRAELLTETAGRGRAGGTLTTKAREILKTE